MTKIIQILRKDLDRDLEEWRTQDSVLKPVGESLGMSILGLGIAYRTIWHIIAHAMIAEFHGDSLEIEGIRWSIFASPIKPTPNPRADLHARVVSMWFGAYLMIPMSLLSFAKEPAVFVIVWANLLVLLSDPFHILAKTIIGDKNG